jgi:hypothetical protein
VTLRGRNDAGVSGAIGSIFLIIIVVAGMAVLMVAVVSQPQPQKVPAMTADVIRTESDLYLKHNGGDTLQKGEFQILVDGQDKTAAFGDPATWSIGQTLKYSGYDPQNLPGTIQIVYTGGRYGQTIEQLWVKPPTLTTSPTGTTATTTLPTTSVPTTATTTTTTTTVTTTATPTATVTTIAPSSYTLLNSQRKGQLISGGYLQFRVTGRYSAITLTNTQYNLSVNDTVKLVVGNNGYGHFDATPSQISTFSFNQIDLYINGVLKDSGKVNSIWVSNYDSYQSTLTVEVPAQSAWTQLIFNGNTLIYGTNASYLQVFNIGTTCGNTLVLDATATNIYFSGCSTGYSIA